jgi:hypothetical protein
VVYKHQAKPVPVVPSRITGEREVGFVGIVVNLDEIIQGEPETSCSPLLKSHPKGVSPSNGTILVEASEFLRRVFILDTIEILIIKNKIINRLLII